MALEPDNAYLRVHECYRPGCHNMTGRRINGRGVCDACYTLGWGRLPGMVVPFPVTKKQGKEVTKQEKTK